MGKHFALIGFPPPLPPPPSPTLSNLGLRTGHAYLCSWPVVVQLSTHQNHPQGLLQHRLPDPHPTVSDPVGLGWDPRIFISNKLLDDTDAADPWPTLGEPLLQTTHRVNTRKELCWGFFLRKNTEWPWSSMKLGLCYNVMLIQCLCFWV